MKKLKLITSRIVSVIPETFDTVTIRLRANTESYLPGQFLVVNPTQFNELFSIISFLKKSKKKNENTRAYSIGSMKCNKNILLTIKINDFCFIKDKYLPLLSPFFACNFAKKRVIHFQGYSGAYVIETKTAKEINGIFYISAGSGIVPNFSLLNEYLYKKLIVNFHILINVNKTRSNIIYNSELRQMEKLHDKIFKNINFLTQEKYCGFFHGKPTFQFIYSIVKKRINNMFMYTCGPSNNKWTKFTALQKNACLKNKFTETIIFFVKKLGLAKKRFKHESYD